MYFIKKLPRSVIWDVGSPHKNSLFPEWIWRTAQGQKWWGWEWWLQTSSRWKAGLIVPHTLKACAPSVLHLHFISYRFASLVQSHLSTWQCMSHLSSRLVTHIHLARFLQKNHSRPFLKAERYSLFKCVSAIAPQFNGGSMLYIFLLAAIHRFQTMWWNKLKQQFLCTYEIFTSSVAANWGSAKKTPQFCSGKGLHCAQRKQGNYWCEKAEGSPALNRVLTQNVCTTKIPCNSVAERIWIFRVECDS